MNVFCSELLLISMRLHYWHGLFLGKNPKCVLSKFSNCTGNKRVMAFVSFDSNGGEKSGKVGLWAAFAWNNDCPLRASFHAPNLWTADNAGRGRRAFPLKIHFSFLSVPVNVAGRLTDNGLGLQHEWSKLKEAYLEGWDPVTGSMTDSWKAKQW